MRFLMNEDGYSQNSACSECVAFLGYQPVVVLSRGVPSNKLPALSSIATKFHAKTGMRYVAGLWEPWLPGALLWRVHKSSSYSKTYVPRPQEWRAPSWSWLAPGRRIEYEKKLSFLVSGEGQLADVVSCDVVLWSSSVSYGEVMDVVLTLWAFPVRCLSILQGSIGDNTLHELDGDTGDYRCIGQVDLNPPFPTIPFLSPRSSAGVIGANRK